MYSDDPPFTDVLHRARTGDAAAWRVLFATINPALRSLAGQLLNRNLWPHHDVEDFTQRAWMVVLGPARDRVFDSAAQLIAFLRVVVRHSITDAARREAARALAGCPTPGPALVEQQSAARGPSAEDDVAQRDWKQVFARRHPAMAPLLTLLDQGYTHSEAARHLCVSPRHVRRMVRELRATVSASIDSPSHPDRPGRAQPGPQGPIM
jgi:RNA polymerase sigma factor (sigma-70 family)